MPKEFHEYRGDVEDVEMVVCGHPDCVVKMIIDAADHISVFHAREALDNRPLTEVTARMMSEAGICLCHKHLVEARKRKLEIQPLKKTLNMLANKRREADLRKEEQERLKEEQRQRKEREDDFFSQFQPSGKTERANGTEVTAPKLRVATG